LHSAADFPRVFDEATRAHVDGVVVMPGALFVSNLKQIADLAARHRLPSIFHLTDFVEAGGLAAYGPDRSDLFRRAATYVDKILKGAKPGDLPVERASTYELSINLKTAKALGLTIPQSILLQVDRILE
jgi:putative ABC transport system substrate-binding protein